MTFGDGSFVIAAGGECGDDEPDVRNSEVDRLGDVGHEEAEGAVFPEGGLLLGEDGPCLANMSNAHTEMRRK